MYIVLLRSHRANSSGTVETQNFRKIVSILLPYQFSIFSILIKVFNQLISLELNKLGK